MIRASFFLLFCFGVVYTQAQEPFNLRHKNGNTASLDQLVAEVKQKPLVFFGELHDNEEAHVMELRLLQALNLAYPGRVILGMEMFEADVQVVLDEYLNDLITERSFLNESRPWPNYQQDYKALVEYAKENKLPIIASNIPRRYANAVYKQGLPVLNQFTKEAKTWLPKLPFQADTTQTTYREMRAMLPDHDPSNMIYSQALKDESMARRIQESFKGQGIVFHINGAYHSKNKEGILRFLHKKNLSKTLTIQTVKEEDFKDSDLSLADYTLIVK